jgi:hypothetical protein
MRLQRQASIVLVAIGLISASTTSVAAGQTRASVGAAVRTVCDQDEEPLFICETNRKDKYIAICAVEEEVGKRWSAVQYRFGLEDRAELVYPANARDGASKLFFSHIEEGTIYHVTIRFASGGFTYRIESTGDSASDPVGDGAAGVTVTDATGKQVAKIACIERPTMFPSYLQRALACDLENPHGKAACGDNPYPVPHAKASRKAPPR